MNSENVFYIYEHWRPDKGVCFYVGKGKDKRAWDMKNMRNCHHKAVVSKLTAMGFSVDVRIIVSGLSSTAALAVEIDRIATYSRETLTNMTRGGDGLVDPSPAVRKRMSESQKTRFARPEEREKMSARVTGRVTSDETKKKLSITSSGRKYSKETIKKMKVAAKIRGISAATREAQVKAITGKKRAPFKESTIIKMRAAAKVREEKKRLAREVS